jgi:hypothetical protein
MFTASYISCPLSPATAYTNRHMSIQTVNNCNKQKKVNKPWFNKDCSVNKGNSKLQLEAALKIIVLHSPTNELITVLST